MDARVWGIVVDSFAKLLIPGITVTIPLTLSFLRSRFDTGDCGGAGACG